MATIPARQYPKVQTGSGDNEIAELVELVELVRKAQESLERISRIIEALASPNLGS